MKKNSYFFTLLTFLISFFASAQDVTVINHYGDTTGLGNDASFFLTNSTQHTLLINYYEPIASEEDGKLEKLIGRALSFYIDRLIKIENDEIILSKNKKTILKELNSIVDDGIKYYNYTPLNNFPGFSKHIELQVEMLFNLDFSNVIKTEIEKYYYIQKELNDLKLQVNIEIGNTSNNTILNFSSINNVGITPNAQAELLAEIKNMSLNDPLENIELELSESLKAILSITDEESKSSDNYDLLYSMIKTNSIQLGEIQKQLKGDTTLNYQNQIDELRSLINELIQNGHSVPSNTLVPNLPKLISTSFGNGESELSLGQQFILNELIDVLAHNPRLKILITGFTNQSGTASSNWSLSKKRAINVRNFLLNRGIDDNRMILNYYGEKFATNNSSEDRKVEIEFFVY